MTSSTRTEEQGFSRHPALIIGGRLMVAWAMFGLPTTSMFAYAQGLPISASDDQLKAAAQARTVDDNTAAKLMNDRAAKLMRSQYDAGSVRTPNLTSDTTTPVRLPKIVDDPGDAARAAQAAGRIQQLTRQQMVNSAQSANGIAQQTYGRVDAANNQLNDQRVEPGLNQTSGTRVNITEVMPGYSPKKGYELRQLGSSLYSNPEQMEAVAAQNRRNLRHDGCRRTDFVMQSRQTIELAPGSADHRILKVEFFDIQKVAIPNTNPVQYQTITTPSTYKRGSVDLQYQTLGGTSNVIWKQVDDTYAIRYTYTPFTQPKSRNYFTYNHVLGISTGGAIQRIPNAIASFGTPSDGWKPAIGYSIPLGVTAVYLSADLYQTQVTYSAPADGVPCASDPPQQCEVSSIDGDLIRWCPGNPGANVVNMYNDTANPSPDRYGKDVNDQSVANAQRKDYSTDLAIRAGVIRGVNATNSDKAKELIGSCRRDSVSHIEQVQGGSYGIPDIQMCSETLVNPFPDGCQGIKRSFGLSYVGEQNYMTVQAFNKVKVAIMDPKTNKQVVDAQGYPLYTYSKVPINVSGSLRTDFSIMGAATCPAGSNCSTEKLPDDPRGSSEGTYVEYQHIPMGGDPKLFVVNGVYPQGGATGNFTDYGTSVGSWTPTGTLVGDGTLHEVRLMAKVYSITINEFAGCQRYMQYAADGYCQGAKLSCTDTAATRTVGDVTFGPGLPNHGIVDLLKKWGTDGSAIVPTDYQDGVSADPSPNGPPISMLDDQMCWQADAQPFTSCATMDVSSGGLRQFMRDGQKWATDCNVTTDQNDVPLETSPSCRRDTAHDECDNRFKGLFTGQCYNPSIAYDCGITKNVQIPVVVEEQGDSCSGAMRCLGTECHRPNLSGTGSVDFAKSASAMEAVNQMVSEMVCAETGEVPTSVDQACTPYIFGGKAMYCKIPIGSSIGITPNCCKEARKGASDAPNWMDYMSAMIGLNKLIRSGPVRQALANSDVYNGISHSLGEISAPVTDLYQSASGWVTQNITSPFRAGFDGLFGMDAQSDIARLAPDAGAKSGAIGEMIKNFEQTLYSGLNDVLQKIGGDELSGMIFQQVPGGAAGQLELTPFLEGFQTVMMVYSIAKIIGHIIFACKQEEFEWGMNDKWRLCTEVGSCCSKKVFLIGCVEKRQLYCCNKSIVSRIISTQIMTKNLTGNRPFGFRTGRGLFGNVSSLGGCDVNCGGFSALELAAVDWSKVDLTEWTDVLIEGGMLNTADPRTNYGISKNTIQSSMAITRTPDAASQYDNKVPAVKSAQVMSDNMDKVIEYNHALKDDVSEQCYDQNKKKMPFTYPGCDTTPP